MSSGSLVRPWAKADWKMLRPSVRKRATSASVPRAGDAAEDAGRDRRRDRRRDEAGRQAADPDREQAGSLAATRPAPGARGRPASAMAATTTSPSGSGTASPVRFAPPRKRRACRRPARRRREVAVRREEQAQDREDEDRRPRSPSRRQVAADPRVAGAEAGRPSAPRARPTTDADRDDDQRRASTKRIWRVGSSSTDEGQADGLLHDQQRDAGGGDAGGEGQEAADPLVVGPQAEGAAARPEAGHQADHRRPPGRRRRPSGRPRRGPAGSPR